MKHDKLIKRTEKVLSKNHKMLVSVSDYAVTRTPAGDFKLVITAYMGPVRYDGKD